MIIIYRTVLIYLFLIFLMRIMGKRQLGELEVSELIVAFMLSELASSPLLNKNEPLSRSIVPILILVLLEVITAFATMKLPTLKRLLYGSPSVIIYEGKLDKSELRRPRLELGELIATARQNGIADFSDVSCCILESDGKLSFFQRKDGAVALPVIMDKRVITKNLDLLGFDRKWLSKKLSVKGLTDKKVFLMTATKDGSIYTIERKKRP